MSTHSSLVRKKDDSLVGLLRPEHSHNSCYFICYLNPKRSFVTPMGELKLHWGHPNLKIDAHMFRFKIQFDHEELFTGHFLSWRGLMIRLKNPLLTPLLLNGNKLSLPGTRLQFVRHEITDLQMHDVLFNIAHSYKQLCCSADTADALFAALNTVRLYLLYGKKMFLCQKCQMIKERVDFLFIESNISLTNSCLKCNKNE